MRSRTFHYNEVLHRLKLCRVSASLVSRDSHSMIFVGEITVLFKEIPPYHRSLVLPGYFFREEVSSRSQSHYKAIVSPKYHVRGLFSHSDVTIYSTPTWAGAEEDIMVTIFFDDLSSLLFVPIGTTGRLLSIARPLSM